MLSLHLFWSLKSAGHGIKKRCEERESKEKLGTTGPWGWTGAWVPHCLPLWCYGWSAGDSDALCHRATHIAGAGDKESKEQLRGMCHIQSRVSWSIQESEMEEHLVPLNQPVRAVWLLLQISFRNLCKKLLWGNVGGNYGKCSASLAKSPWFR